MGLPSFLPPVFDSGFNGSTVRERWLCSGPWFSIFRGNIASMGPPSENGGYNNRRMAACVETGPLQWVHRPRTVVMKKTEIAGRQPSQASMGPPSENGGYVRCAECCYPTEALLQWVHRPRTVVMACW